MKGEHKAPQRHYACMSLADIQQLPVAGLAQKNCLLWCWATWPMLPEALETIAAWGFRYVTGGAWTKRTSTGKMVFGPGYVMRSATEPFLVGIIGRPRYQSRSVRNAIDALRREHSRKPDEQYEMIEQLIEPPYCELFSRTDRPGWDSWGDQTGMFK